MNYKLKALWKVFYKDPERMYASSSEMLVVAERNLDVNWATDELIPSQRVVKTEYIGDVYVKD